MTISERIFADLVPDTLKWHCTLLLKGLGTLVPCTFSELLRMLHNN